MDLLLSWTEYLSLPTMEDVDAARPHNKKPQGQGQVQEF